MKFGHTVSFDLKSIDLIDEYMKENRMSNFSLAVCNIIQEHERFRKIIKQLTKKD